MKVVLTESEARIVEWLAAQRSCSARKNNIKDAKIGPQNSLQIDIDGLKGEFAFAKLFNLWPDLQIGRRSIHDVESCIGGIDIKTTRYRTGRLLASRKKLEIPSVWYALMWLEDDKTVHCVGAAPASELLNESRLKDLGRGVGYAMEQAELIPPHRLKEMFDAVQQPRAARIASSNAVDPAAILSQSSM